MLYLKKFNNISDYEDFIASTSYTTPNVSLVEEDNSVHYNVVFDKKWLATYADGHAESSDCGESTSIVYEEITGENLKKVRVGDCVTRINNSAFNDFKSITAITLGNNVESIGNGAFAFSSLVEINLPNSLTNIEDAVFMDCTSLKEITIPSSITSISANTFLGCSALTSVTLNNGLITIGANAFAKCYSLTSINIPDSVTSIGYNAFEVCSGLTSINVPSSVTSIGNGAFAWCSGLTAVTINAITPPTLGNSVFSGSSCPIYVPAESVSAYKSASGWSSYSDRIQPIP